MSAKRNAKKPYWISGMIVAQLLCIFLLLTWLSNHSSVYMNIIG